MQKRCPLVLYWYLSKQRFNPFTEYMVALEEHIETCKIEMRVNR